MSAKLISVRRRDLLEPPPDRHPRYPSPGELRGVLSFCVDVVAHLAVGVLPGIWGLYVLHVAPDLPTAEFLLAAGLLGFIPVSFVDRVVVQWACRATIGKALTGLRMIRPDTGGRGTFWQYLREWLVGAVQILDLVHAP
jgi:hypothetical protein